MNADVRALLACPGCRGPLSAEWECEECGARFDAPDGIPNLRLDGDVRTERVRQFYERAPFPGYPPRDSLSAFRARAERSRLPRLLDRAIAADARIAEIGCGTGQISLYLDRTDRLIVAADLSRAALTLGARAAARYGVQQVQFVETDLQRPGLKRAAFDVVYSSGVLHHTPNPRRAFAGVAELARPGGIVIVGLYNALARIPLRVRRAIARLTRFRVVAGDPILRERRDEPERRAAWLRDQYQHPEEHCHTIGEIQRWFAENGMEYLRSYPSTVFEDESDDLFARAVDDWALERSMAQIGWIWSLGGEGGLFLAIGRRPFDEPTPQRMS